MGWSSLLFKANSSFCYFFVVCIFLFELQIPKSVRLAEEWQGKQPRRNHHVPHMLTESERKMT